MVLTISLTNTVEYNEWKTGSREESIIFSLRPLMAKLGSSLVQLIVLIVYIVAGVSTYQSMIANQERQADILLRDLNSGLSITATVEVIFLDPDKDAVRRSPRDLVAEALAAHGMRAAESLIFTATVEDVEKTMIGNDEVTDIQAYIDAIILRLHTLSDNPEIVLGLSGGQFDVAREAIALDRMASITAIIDEVPDTSKNILLILMIIIPVLFIVGVHFLYKGKYFISEDKYAGMIDDLKTRREAAKTEAAVE